MGHVRKVLAAALTAVALMSGAGWAWSYWRPGVMERELGGKMYSLVNRAGKLEGVCFSAEAEAGGYREVEVRYWQVEMVAAPLAALAWWWALRRRRARGFPVEAGRRGEGVAR